MKFSAYNLSDIKEIKQLYINTFSDSEGQSEGVLIGELGDGLMTKTPVNDFYVFVATEKKEIVGSIIF